MLDNDVDRNANLRFELIAWLDTQAITSDNIGDIRRSLFVPWDSAWNGWVRDETAERENRSASPQTPPRAQYTATATVQRLIAELRADLTRACDYHETRNPTWTLAGAVRDRLKHAMGQIERLCATDAQEATAERPAAQTICPVCLQRDCHCGRLHAPPADPPPPRSAAQEAPFPTDHRWEGPCGCDDCRPRFASSASQEAQGLNDWDVQRMLRLRARHESNVAAGTEESDLDFLFRMLSFRVAGDATPQHGNGPTQACSSVPPVDVAALRALSGEMVHDAVTRAPSDPVRIALHDYIRKLDCLVGKHTSPDRKCSVHGTGECWCMP